MMTDNLTSRKKQQPVYGWLMLAFSPAAGFARSKGGTSWYAHFATRELAILAKQKLVAAGIAFKCRKVIAPDAGRTLSQKHGARAPRIEAELARQETKMRSVDALKRADRIGREYRAQAQW